MIVILHNIRSLYNVASIFRTADAAGIEKIYLCGITPGPLDRFGQWRRQFIKVSLGAEKTIAWEKCISLNHLIDKFKKAGYKIFAIEQSHKSIPYYKVAGVFTPKSKVVLILGSEVSGLPSAILKKSDKILEIPMRGRILRHAGHPRYSGYGKESLNVSVAFAIVVFGILYK